MVPALAVVTLCACSASPKDSRSLAQAPRTVKEGATFAIGNYTVVKGWKIANDGVGGFAADGVSVKNTSAGADTAYFRMTLIAGTEVLATIDCNTSEIEAGQVQDANCLDTGLDSPMSPRHRLQTGWDRITVESKAD